MHVSSSYAKILGETNFHTREFSRSESKAKDGEERKKKEQKLALKMTKSEKQEDEFNCKPCTE